MRVSLFLYCVYKKIFETVVKNETIIYRKILQIFNIGDYMATLVTSSYDDLWRQHTCVMHVFTFYDLFP